MIPIESVDLGESDVGSEKKKCQLVNYDDLPHFMKHNEFILGQYRSEWPWKETFLSIFSVHNETINVWTHLIGFLLFLALTVGTIVVVPVIDVGMKHRHQEQVLGQGIRKSASCLLPYKNEINVSYSYMNDTFIYLPQMLLSLLPPSLDGFSNPNITNTDQPKLQEDEGDKNQISRWPFYAFLVGAMICLLTSSFCHLLSCHSEHTSYVMLRLDYAGITALIVTSFYPLVYYAFLCHPFYRNLYIGFITLFGVATVLVSLIPVFETPEFTFARAGLFVCMGISGFVPIVHNLVLNGHRPEVLVTAAYEIIMGIFYMFGALLYVAKVPERWLPGKFDLAGHSHQLFHLMVIAGSYTHYLAILLPQQKDVEILVIGSLTNVYAANNKSNAKLFDFSPFGLQKSTCYI